MSSFVPTITLGNLRCEATIITSQVTGYVVASDDRIVYEPVTSWPGRWLGKEVKKTERLYTLTVLTKGSYVYLTSKDLAEREAWAEQIDKLIKQFSP